MSEARPDSREAPAAPSLRVRPVRREDVPRVWELLRGLAEYEKLTDILTGTPQMLEAALFAERGPKLEGLVAEDGAELVGYALFYSLFGSFRARWRLWLEDLYVTPEARGRGAGEKLMAELCRRALERDCFSVDWEVLDWNAPAMEFYRRRGGRDLGGGWQHWRIDGDAMRRLADEAAR